MSATLQRLLSEKPLTTDAWVQCDGCKVWRRVPAVVAERLGDNAAWFCHQNYDQNFSTCDDPQELEDHEIDVLMQAQEDAARRNAKSSSPGKLKPAVPTNEWFKITRNIFTHREPKKVTEDDVMICSCVVEDGVGCGPDCLNRLVLSECDPAYCPCEGACANQRLSRKQYKSTDVRRTGKKGHGLFAAENVKTGDFILEYLGEVLHEDEYHERKQRYQDEGRSHYYFMTLSSSETIDATIRGNSGRFLNHSCAPNCETQKWMVRGELCIGIFATRDIAAGEELTIDYKFERFGEKPSRCFCMAGACCGWIGGAKAAEAAKSYNIDSDDEEGHENDLEPVMHELDDAQIAAEEAKGRELMADRFTPKKTAVRAESKAWRPPEEVREIERQRKEREREENRAARASRPSGSNVRRVRAPAGSYAQKWSAMSAGAKKRTEVDLRMEEYQSTSGGLRSREVISHFMGLFNLCFPVDADGRTEVSTRDLGLILEAISLTKNPNLQAALVENGILSQFQKCIHVLGGPEASAAQAPLLRKILKILADFMLHGKDVLVPRLSETKTARGTLMKAIGDLRVANDTPLMKVARDFELKYIPSGTMGPMPERPRPQAQQMRRTDSGSGSPRWGSRAPSNGSLNRYGSSGALFNSGAPPGSALSGRSGGFNGSAPRGSAMTGGRGGGGWGPRGGGGPQRGGYPSHQGSAPPTSSLAQAMRPQAPGYPPRPGGWNAPGGNVPGYAQRPYDDGRGVKREREESRPPPPPPAQQRANKPILTAPLPPQFEDPLGELFSDAVTAFVTMEVEELRAPSNPLHQPGANYDRLTQRWALGALTKEQDDWDESMGPLSVGDVRQRVAAYVKDAARKS